MKLLGLTVTIAAMALKITVEETEFGVGDRVRVVQKIKDETGKSREATFEGMVLAIRGRNPGKTVVIRKVADGNVGVERIFPVNLPSIERVVVVKSGTSGSRRAKLYYTRTKSPTEIDKIFKRTQTRGQILSKAVSKKTSKRVKIDRAPKSSIK